MMMAIKDIRNPTSGGCLRGVQDQLEDMMVGLHCKEFQHLALVVLTPFFLVPFKCQAIPAERVHTIRVMDYTSAVIDAKLNIQL